MKAVVLLHGYPSCTGSRRKVGRGASSVSEVGREWAEPIELVCQDPKGVAWMCFNIARKAKRNRLSVWPRWIPCWWHHRPVDLMSMIWRCVSQNSSWTFGYLRRQSRTVDRTLYATSVGGRRRRHTLLLTNV